ncbi:protein CNPPD1-like [Oppia nitens]|uniref:protein CNPPD1-like n=1 Tax=Oppia nitens TaxID=1686743 RepID=UPI0023DBA6E0|nr:protein CNPPD1-like [Oppia nitens]
MTTICTKGSPKVGRHLSSTRNHMNLVDRLRKSLYYGSIKCGSKESSMDCPSMPLTEVTVELFEKTVTSGAKGLDVFDMNFVSHVSREACITPTSIMLSMIYLERLKTRNPEYLRRVSTCDLFLVSIMIASKFLFDDGEEDEVFNDEWANSADIDVKQLNRLEREFLKAINWSLYVDNETFMKQLAKVEALISLNQSNKRCDINGMTYSELLALFDYSMTRRKDGSDILWREVVSTVTKLLVVSCVAYWTTVFALVASTAISRVSLDNTQTNVNQSLLINDSLLAYYPNDLFRRKLSDNLRTNDLVFSLCDKTNAKFDVHLSYDRPEDISYRTLRSNNHITSRSISGHVINLCVESTPKTKHSFNNYHKY